MAPFEFLITPSSGAVNDLTESNAAVDSNLLETEKGRKGSIGESRLHDYLRFNAEETADQSVQGPIVSAISFGCQTW